MAPSEDQFGTVPRLEADRSDRSWNGRKAPPLANFDACVVTVTAFGVPLATITCVPAHVRLQTHIKRSSQHVHLQVKFSALKLSQAARSKQAGASHLKA